jgi:2-amino-4-hydroxy-6-hydroxymethyldihydropteridine diphosphokinase/dihydropteroate synthase
MSMRILRIRRSAIGPAIPQKYGSPIRLYEGSKPFSPFLTRRHQSTSTKAVSSKEWTPHTLNPSSLSSSQSSIISQPSENAAKKHIAYIALGSNLGDRIDWIEKACNEMSKRGIKVKRTSSLWETEPMYVTDQDSFINGACEVSLSAFSRALETTKIALERRQSEVLGQPRSNFC